MFHWCSVYWPLLWFLSSPPPFPLPPYLLQPSPSPFFGLTINTFVSFICLTPTPPPNSFRSLNQCSFVSLYTSYPLPSSLSYFCQPNQTTFCSPGSIATLTSSSSLPPPLMPSISSRPTSHHHGNHHLPPLSNAGWSDLYLRLSSSSSSAPPLPVLCSAVSLSKDGHASKSLYPLRYVQPLLLYLNISISLLIQLCSRSSVTWRTHCSSCLSVSPSLFGRSVCRRVQIFFCVFTQSLETVWLVDLSLSWVRTWKVKVWVCWWYVLVLFKVFDLF